MNEPKMASLTLHASPNGDGPDGIRMEVDFGGDFDSQSTVHNIINHFANQLIDGSDLLRKRAAEQDEPRIVLAGGA